MYKLKVDIEVKNKLMNLRNKYGFLDMNHTIKYLLKNENLVTKEDIEKMMQTKDIPTEIQTKMIPDEAIPIIVPKPNTEEQNIQTVKCPKCQTKFKANMDKPIKCPTCGLEGRS